MALIIDFHVHVWPDPLERWEASVPRASIDQLRSRARKWYRPFANSLHRAQAFTRTIPDGLRWPLDQLAGILPVSGLLLESSEKDLERAMEEAGVDRAVVIAHPPMISNERVLEASRRNDHLVPAVSVRPRAGADPREELESWFEKGAKLLKIHPAVDREPVDSPHYEQLLDVAGQLGLPVVIHTGCVHASALFKSPELARAELYAPWFRRHPGIDFILAHMNFHEPEIAMDLAQEFANVHVDTSWQPSEVIGEAVRRAGAERVLFATDWPYVGNNLTVGRRRVADCIETGTITGEQAELVLGGNAQRILGL